jgi:hypothetical protein
MFLNPPFIGTCLGALIGLVPTLHTLFFSPQSEGGYLNAWLTAALKNVGDLFAALQVIVVGIKLSSSLLKWKKGEASGTMPWGPWALVTVVRFVFWPAVAIPLVYVFATKTSALEAEPILWFAMMLMPTGPPALSITAMADVSGADEEQKLSIAKFLTVSLFLFLRPSLGGLVFCGWYKREHETLKNRTLEMKADNPLLQQVSYAVSPLICFSVVGALKASQAAVQTLWFAILLFLQKKKNWEGIESSVYV